MKVAVIDDEKNLCKSIQYALEMEGFETMLFHDGSDAWETLSRSMADLVILDIIMPRMSGLELCRRIRNINPYVPLIFLSSKDDELDRVLGLEIGADDYLTKPFSMRELLSRVKALFRRMRLQESPQAQEPFLSVPPLTLWLDRIRCEMNGTAVNLTITEFRILEALVRAEGAPRTREQLLKAAFPDDLYLNDRSADSHIKRIRKKLSHENDCPDIIETIYGLGYRLNMEGAAG
ncbi:MAG: response regulator transcription factor [Spirochaetales bacterium]|nr:response regulator transcription factor [Spirochaetales bacterium]